jgi:integrase
MKAQESQNRLWQKTKFSNLVRNTTSGKYFARFRHQGKLFWRSLDTDVLSVAAQRLKDKIEEVVEQQSLASTASDPKITFGKASQIYLQRVKASPDYKLRTKAYHEERLEGLFRSWPGLKNIGIRDLSKAECLAWRSRFAAKYSPTSFNHTLGILRAIIEIGMEFGARRDNPAKAKEMARLGETSKKLRLPEHHQFDAFVQAIASSGSGHSKPCAELVQFLAFGGFRISEAKHITWADCDFKSGKITVCGDPEEGLKGRGVGETREVPMIPDMRRLLERLRKERSDEPLTARVMRVAECQKAMTNAATTVGIARITHHDLRHLFATRCIESGVDIPTVSRWLGHKDGGALAMKTYGHLRDQHSTQMANKVSFMVEAAEKKTTERRNGKKKLAATENNSAQSTDDQRKAAAAAKAKYSLPWWVSKDPLELFWGQLNEPVQIIPKEKFLAAAAEAMNREVAAEEFDDREALKDEFQLRIGEDKWNQLVSKFSTTSKKSQEVSSNALPLRPD